jgi:hypothetical protein
MRFYACSEYSSKGETSGPPRVLPSLFVRVCKTVVSTLLIAIVSSWYRFLWIVPIKLARSRRGPTFSSPIVYP